jgi:hypothetical protein
MYGCKDMTPPILGRFWKKRFSTQMAVAYCDPRPKQLTCLAGGGEWREDQHMWDGQGFKDPCFF